MRRRCVVSQCGKALWGRGEKEGRRPQREPVDAGAGPVGAPAAEGQGGWSVRGLTRWRLIGEHRWTHEGQEGGVWLIASPEPVAQRTRAEGPGVWAQCFNHSGKEAIAGAGSQPGAAARLRARVERLGERGLQAGKGGGPEGEAGVVIIGELRAPTQAATGDAGHDGEDIRGVPSPDRADRGV